MSTTLRPLHIAVIDPGTRVPEVDNYNRLVLGNPEVRFSYHLPALFGMSSLQLINEQPGALIIFGSGASVYDDLPWQAELNPYLKQKIDQGVPTLGICYGHQLLAYLYGGKIDFAVESQEKYKGLRTINFTKPGFWSQNEGQFVVSHREVVTALPGTFETCASSAVTQHEVIKHKDLKVWGIQAHPEAGPEFIQNSSIPLTESDKAPFKSGTTFMRDFISHLIE